jgi:hypothetical protein
MLCIGVVFQIVDVSTPLVLHLIQETNDSATVTETRFARISHATTLNVVVGSGSFTHDALNSARTLETAVKTPVGAIELGSGRCVGALRATATIAKILHVSEAAEEAMMPFACIFILFGRLDWTTAKLGIFAGFVEKSDSGAWSAEAWDADVRAAVSLEVVALANDVVCHTSHAARVEHAVRRVVGGTGRRVGAARAAAAIEAVAPIIGEVTEAILPSGFG